MAGETALLLIDLQKAIDHPSWGERNNPGAEENAARLLAAWRAADLPIYHVRHDSIKPHSTYRPGQEGNQFKECVRPAPGEAIIIKRTNSAFIGTGLEARLRAAGHTRLVIAGCITNNSVETTVRMAGNLGFETYLVSDATFTFDKIDWDGHRRTAQEVHALSLANLHEEYCTVVNTELALALL